MEVSIIEIILSSILNVKAIGSIIVGTSLGIFLGAMPGLGTSLGIILLLPFTYDMPMAQSIMMLVGVGIGGFYGGSIPAVLLCIPGDSPAVMTTLDGYPMSQKGEGGRALGLATVSSFIGGIFSLIVLIFTAPYLVRLALEFGPAEYFALAIFGLSAIISAASGSLLKGLSAGVFGLLIAMVGIDPIYHVPRFTFGNVYLMSGISLIPLLIGLFGLGEILIQIKQIYFKKERVKQISNLIPTLEDLKVCFKTFVKGSAVGTFFGSLPGAGAMIGSIVSYNINKQTSKYPEKYGTGIPEGIAASETANNAVTGGAMIPLLSLGIPGNVQTAILIGAFLIHGVQPGPLFFRTQPEVIYTIYTGMFVANIYILIFGLSVVRYVPKLIEIDPRILYPIIIILCIIGSYSVSNSIFDIYIMIIFGVIGFVMRVFGFSVAPTVLGIVLGPLAEVSFRNSLALYADNPFMIFTRPMCVIIWLLTFFLLLFPYFYRRYLNTQSKLE